MTAPHVSIVIPAHNAAATIGAQLEALRPQGTDLALEIIVVDNASTDGTDEVVHRLAQADPRIRLLHAPAGRGPSYARNIGIAAARGDHLLCCDSDDVVGATWVEDLASALEDHLYVGGPLEVDRLNAGWLAEARGRWGASAPGRFGNIDFAHGCNLAIRRDVFRKVGGFDERLRAGEEIDLALRLFRIGIRLHFVESALVHYRYRTTVSANCKQSFSFGRVGPILERRARDLDEYARERATLRRTAWLVPNAVRLTNRAGRVRWTWIAAGLCGRAVGKAYALVA